MKTKYYISPFNFFYAEYSEELAEKFSQLAFGASWTSESENDTLLNCLEKICSAYEKMEPEFNASFISIQQLISGVLLKYYGED